MSAKHHSSHVLQLQTRQLQKYTETNAKSLTNATESQNSNWTSASRQSSRLKALNMERKMFTPSSLTSPVTITKKGAEGAEYKRRMKCSQHQTNNTTSTVTNNLNGNTEHLELL
jgi:hypothetical protein